MMALKVKNILAQDTILLSLRRLWKEYQDHRNQYKQKDSILVIQFLTSDTTSTPRDEIHGMMYSESLKQKYGGSSFVLMINDETRRLYAEDDSKLLEFSDSAAVGEVSGWQKIKDIWRVLVCLKRYDAGYYTFDELREAMRTRVVEEAYEALVAERLTKSKIKWKDRDGPQCRFP
jgi:heme oxygenase